MADKKDTETSIMLKLLEDVSKDVKDTKTTVSSLETDFKLHKQESQARWDAIEKLDKEQNEILATHASRSDRLEQDNLLRERGLRADIFAEGVVDPDKRKKTLIGRVEGLEFPMKAGKWTFGLAAGILAILKAIDLISKHL